MLHPESQVNHRNHSFVVGWDKISPWSTWPGKGAFPSTPSRGLQWLPLFWMQYIKPSHASCIGFFMLFWNKLKKFIYYNLVSVATCLKLIKFHKWTNDVRKSVQNWKVRILLFKNVLRISNVKNFHFEHFWSLFCQLILCLCSYSQDAKVVNENFIMCNEEWIILYNFFPFCRDFLNWNTAVEFNKIKVKLKRYTATIVGSLLMYSCMHDVLLNFFIECILNILTVAKRRHMSYRHSYMLHCFSIAHQLIITKRTEYSVFICIYSRTCIWGLAVIY